MAYLALVDTLDTFDPSMAEADTITDALVRTLFAGLFRITSDGVSPDLVESWTASPDGLTQTFVLKEGLTWSDGMPLTAHDAEFGILNSMSPGVAGSSPPDADLLASVIRGGKEYLDGEGDSPPGSSGVGVRAIDDLTLEIETTSPGAFLQSILARPSAFPQPRHAVASDPLWGERADLVSNGPFLVGNRVAGGNLVLVRNPDYDGPGLSRLDGIVFLNAPVGAATSMVEAGTVSAIAGMTLPESATELSLAPNTAAEIVPGRAAYSLRFDVSQPPFDNVLARRAFAAAVDREALLKDAVTGSAQITTTLVPAGTPGSLAPGSGVGVEYDLQGARDLLARAGYTDFQTLEGFTLLHAGVEQDRLLAESIAQFWREAFGLIIRVEESGRNDVTWPPTPGPTVWIERYESPYLDADGWLRLLYRSGSALNAGGYAESAFDAAVDQGGVFTNPDDRARAYRQAETILVGIDVAVLPLYVEDTYRWSQDGLIEQTAPGGAALIESWDIP